MLYPLLLRTWSPLLLSTLLISTLPHFRPHLPPTAYFLLLLIPIFYALRTFTLALLTERKIDRLGKRAPVLRDFAPWGVGTLVQALWYFSRWRNHEFWWKMFGVAEGKGRRGYTVEAITAGQRIIFTADEENIKAMLATQFQDFGKGPVFRSEWMDFLGYSIFTTDGEQWHNSRQLLRPQFIKDRVSDLNIFESHVQVLLPMLAGTEDSATVRIDELFFRFTIDAATDFLFGSHENSLQNSQTEFAEAFTEVSRVQGTIARAGPLNNLVPRGSFYRGLKVINEFIGHYIDIALQLPQEELQKRTKSSEGYTFLHALASYTRDRNVLRDQIIAVLLAGRDTTATTMSWLFYELSRHPAVVEKLRREILKVVGSHREPTYEDLKSMRFLTHTLNETLRLYPVVPYNVRVALQDTTIPFGGGPDGCEPVAVLKDTPVGYSTFILQRRPEIYPPTSPTFPHYLDFAPDRWEQWTPAPWTYIPFNGGPRICIGQQFALTEMAYVVTRILQTYETVESRQEEFPGLRSDIVLIPARGVRVEFKKA